MDILSIVILAIGLAADCFAVSVCKGMTTQQLPWMRAILMALLFGIFQGGMPLITFFLGIGFAQYITPIDHWIAFVLLAFIGGKMIVESFKDEADKPSQNFSWITIITLAFATSIDALAMGIIFVPYPQLIAFAVAIIATTSFVASLGGSTIGFFFGKKFKLNVELIGGIILVGMGTKILIEHLFA